MIFSEDDLLPISALSHFIFCERRAALIHIEQAWTENLFTAEGRIMHERVHKEDSELRGNIRIEYSMPLRSLHLGLIGKADVVEFHRKQILQKTSQIEWQPFPVEYKRGKPKRDNSDKVQLCAQAICLEEMYGTNIPEGALFYGKTRRREAVAFDSVLRDETIQTAQLVHQMLEKGITPPPAYTPKCESCSLVDLCLPKIIGKRRSVKTFLENMVREK